MRRSLVIINRLLLRESPCLFPSSSKASSRYPSYYLLLLLPLVRQPALLPEP